MTMNEFRKPCSWPECADLARAFHEPGALDEATISRIEMHLFECPTCEQAFFEMSTHLSAQAFLRDYPVPVPASRSVAQTLRLVLGTPATIADSARAAYDAFIEAFHGAIIEQGWNLRLQPTGPTLGPPSAPTQDQEEDPQRLTWRDDAIGRGVTMTVDEAEDALVLRGVLSARVRSRATGATDEFRAADDGILRLPLSAARSKDLQDVELIISS